jgi:hypothetical protein
VTEEANNGLTDWTNDANATGSRDGAVASLTGSVIAARSGRLVVSYDDFVGKTNLIITAARLTFYLRITGAVDGTADMTIGYRRGAETTNRDVAAFISNVDHLANGVEFDVLDTTLGGSRTNGVRNWSDLDGLRAYCRALCQIGETHTHELDAVELRVTATHTETA